MAGARELTIQLRRGTRDKWIQKNPILLDGEPGFETDTGNFKLGDGESTWIQLDYFMPDEEANPSNEGPVMSALTAHINSLTPHAAYDDGPSLLLLYQNAKV